MKNLLITISLILMAGFIYGQGAIDDKKAPVLTFDKEVIDYGTIVQNSNGVREFKFKNTGRSTLIIQRCKGSCGCTVPTCTKEPIKKGKTGVIKVKYATNRLGQFNKTVSVYSNAKTPVKKITIKGNVIKPPTKKEIEK